MDEAVAPLPRDRHLFDPGPKRILALDGGGVRGTLSIAFLERMEQLLAEDAGAPVRLCDAFDLIGGTSTGAIISGGLALGHSASAMRDLYARLAPRVFQRNMWRIKGLRAKFDAARLREELKAIIGDRTLDSPDLLTGFCVVMKRMDTGSPWIVSNNPLSVFWNHPPDASFIGNRSYPLAALIRASTAAPHYFDPELLDILGRGELGLFVDGGMTPYNNPSLHLTFLATLPQHRIGWPLGADNLTVVSIGTGSFRDQMPHSDHRRISPFGLAIRALFGLMDDTQLLTVGLMQAMGETPTPWTINSEVEAMTGWPIPGGPLFRHVRYDVRLEQVWLERELGLSLSLEEVLRLQRMDEPASMPKLYEIGRLAAERQVRLEHFANRAGAAHAAIDQVRAL